MKWLLALLALVPPPPVIGIGATINVDTSVTVFWTLPADPAVVGVTVIRERLDFFEPTVVFTLGVVTDFTDATGLIEADYRYWVYTRNAAGELSIGNFVTIIGLHDHAHSSTSFWCFAAAAPRVGSWPVLLGAALMAAALLLRRQA